MQFTLNSEQQLLQDSVRRFVEKDYAFEARAALLAVGPAGAIKHWDLFAENGWLAAALPEAYGGLGGSALDTTLIAQELGRGLVLAPYLGSAVLAAQTLRAAASEEQLERWVPALADGSRRVALAYSEAGAAGIPEACALRADAADDGWLLHGVKTLVLGGADADAYIVSARLGRAEHGPEEITLFLVDAHAPGLNVRPLPLHDGTWAAEVTFDGVLATEAAVLGTRGAGLDALHHGLAHATAALGAELIGAMDKAVEITAEYLTVRKQFGVPIGSFQALQHRMADMAAELEIARSMHYTLLASIENDAPSERRLATSQAKALICRAAKYVCGQAIQLHGGIGMTEEYAIGHYYKRAVVADIIFGSSDRHEAICAELLQQSLSQPEFHNESL